MSSELEPKSVDASPQHTKTVRRTNTKRRILLFIVESRSLYFLWALLQENFCNFRIILQWPVSPPLALNTSHRNFSRLQESILLHLLHSSTDCSFLQKMPARKDCIPWNSAPEIHTGTLLVRSGLRKNFNPRYQFASCQTWLSELLIIHRYFVLKPNMLIYGCALLFLSDDPLHFPEKAEPNC